MQHAEAVFIVCDKYAPDAALQDRRHSLALLAVGQYLAVRVCLCVFERGCVCECGRVDV